MKQMSVCPLVLLVCAVPSVVVAQAAAKPNVILVMSDDQGWGDVGYNGHATLQTPHLDGMAKEGIRFNRWYAAAPVCSPTRASCMTGRHPFRQGIPGANKGHMRQEEHTLAELLKEHGYTTGHFGKWHLGTLTKKGRDSNRGGARNLAHYSPPWRNGFDVCFSTEAKVPTWNPMTTPARVAGGVGKKERGTPYGTAYWAGPEQRVEDNLEGDDSRIIMDRALPFIENAVLADKPFLAVIWFHAPHLPVVAGPRHLAKYPGSKGKTPHYLGCITALDEQVGRLRKTLARLGVAKDTMLWFCADNGPEGRRNRAPGTAGPLRGRKRSLYEGGVRVPGLLVWPRQIKKARVVDMPCSTSDYFPTIEEVLGLTKAMRPLDGVSLLPLLRGDMTERPTPIAFEAGGQLSLIDNRFKLIKPRRRDSFELYDIVDDPGEKKDLAATHPEVVTKMTKQLEEWRASCRASAAGKDYRR